MILCGEPKLKYPSPAGYRCLWNERPLSPDHHGKHQQRAANDQTKRPDQIDIEP
jgi:hypothetical protein